jgi:hypothetical protein
VNDRGLTLLGTGNFRGNHEAAHSFLVQLRILHVYEDGPQGEHRWGSGWVSEAARKVLNEQ